MKTQTRWLDRYTVTAPHLTLCLSEAEFLKAAKHCDVADPGRWLDEDRNMGTAHTWQQRDKLVCVVCLHPDAIGADPIQVACVLAHEAVHVWQRLCESIGETEPSREFEAYSIDRLSESLMREFARRVRH